jgi:nitric oxide reductase NorE protein
METTVDRGPTSSERPYPGQGSMWFFVIGELGIFLCYFACYAFERAHDPSAFLEGQRLLSPGIGVLNTVILLTSSLFVAMGVETTRAGDFKAAARLLALGGACGLGFMLVKGGEWAHEIGAGLPAKTYPFFTYYFMLTGLHYFHVVLGLVILGLGWRELRGSPARRPPRRSFVEAVATYWHMVDSLWMAIFAALYLMR